MNIKSIKIDGYRGMRDVKVELKPLTIFVGANSAGKSSVQRLIRIFSQSKSSGAEVSSCATLSLNGPNISAGNLNSFFNYHKGKGQGERASFEIELTVPHSLHDVCRSVHNQIKKYVSDSVMIMLEELGDKTSPPNWGDLVSSLSWIVKQVGKMEKKIDHEDLKKIPTLSQGRLFKQCVTVCEELKQHSVSRIDLVVVRKKNHSNPVIQTLKMIDESNKIVLELSLNRVRTNNYNLFSEYVPKHILEQHKAYFLRDIYFRGVEPDWLGAASLEHPIQKLFLEIWREVSHKIFGNLHSVTAISPLREVPKRYYTEEAYDTRNWWDRDRNATYLAYERLNKVVNNWLKKLGVSVNYKKLNSTLSVIEARHDNIPLDVTDVGFGISQVLPVLLYSVWADRNELILIEQPEIHLHPKAQADLVDFFIERSKDNRFIIETHSEAFLRRLRRRIAEYDLESGQGVSYENVAICNFERNEENGRLCVNNQKISPTGEFEWPKGFRDVEKEDTFAFLKAQLAAELAQEAKAQDV
ncbi:MAG: AAA family ATPase [Halodesulfovibrio sp.]|uniref:AAA family ATPase n=1 Tax=Halodesulfovibrio sp. TaxID=1912772 RepID=UPI00359CC4BF